MLKLRRFEPRAGELLRSGHPAPRPDAGPDPVAAAAAAAVRRRARARLLRGAAARRRGRRALGAAPRRPHHRARGADAPDGRDRPLRHAVESAPPSWLDDEALALMRRFDVALVAADTAGRHPLSAGADGPLRLRAAARSTELYASRYSDEELARGRGASGAWASSGSDVFVYFDNDARAHAPHDALRLRRMLAPAQATNDAAPITAGSGL